MEEGTGVGIEDVHIRRAQSEGNFDDDEADEGKEDSSSGEADLGGGAEEDMEDWRDFSDNGSSGDLEDFSDNGSSGDLEDDSTIEGLWHIVEEIKLQYYWREMWQIQGPDQVGDVNLSERQIL